MIPANIIQAEVASLERFRIYVRQYRACSNAIDKVLLKPAVYRSEKGIAVTLYEPPLPEIKMVLRDYGYANFEERIIGNSPNGRIWRFTFRIPSEDFQSRSNIPCRGC